MSGLRLLLFGVPRLERNGEILPINRRKGLAMLAYIVLRQQPQSRDALATLLWPEFDQSRALSNLRRELSRLKSDLEDDILEADRMQIGLAPDARLWVDVNRFRHHLVQLAAHDHHFPDEPCPECLAALTEAVALRTERFLEGFSLPDASQFDDWQFFEAEELDRAFGDALQRLIRWHATGADADYEKAIVYGRRWLALDTLHEPAHRELMILYARAGQQAAALRQYEECARLFEEELGIEPEPETRALYEAIRTRQFPEADDPTHSRELAPAAIPLPASPERYRLEEKLAVGSQGEVFLARDLVAGRPVVIKRLRPELCRDDSRVARFVREGKLLGQLDHPNIVHMLAAFKHEGHHCIVMEYVAGGTLADLLAEQGALPVSQALAVALELADALGRAHHLGIIHRDLKPGNVLLTETGAPRLTDFGTARLEREDVRLTQTGTIVGSPAYMSPEALRGDELDPRSDIWSFGILLYEMLAGRRPFDGESVTQIIVAILDHPAPALVSLRDDLPPALVALVERMLAKEAADRPPTMRQVAAELEAIRDGKWEATGGGVVARSRPAPPRPAAPPALLPAVSAVLPERPFAPTDQHIHFTTSADGTRIGYAVVGQGPPLVKVANPLTHLQYDWESPVWRHWVEELSRERTLIRYDERGCGLSAREVADFSMDAWVSDLEAVVDDLGLGRFPVIGTSQGASVAVAYAVRHPERVSHLICCGGYARGRFHRELTEAQWAETEALLNLIRFGWGQESPAFRQVFATLFVPEGTPAQHGWFTELARITADPETAARMERAFYEVDVCELAPRVKAPTLVLHPEGDQMVPFAEGRLLADLIPGAKFVPLASNNHLLLEDEPAWSQFLSEVDRFLEGAAGPDPGAQAPFFGGMATVASGARAPAAADVPAYAVPFVGRERELAWLEKRLAAAIAGRGGVCFVVGEAGQGKTTLIKAFIRRAQAAHPRLIAATGYCNAYTGQGDPYLPFREILELLTGAVDRDAAGGNPGTYTGRLLAALPQTLAALLEEAPDLLDSFLPLRPLLQRARSQAPAGTPLLASLEARATRNRATSAAPAESALFAQYAALLVALARRQPLLLFVDDLQWSDRNSANLLLHLGKRLATYPILLVGAYRPAEVGGQRDGERHPLQQVVRELQRDFGPVSLDLAESDGHAFLNALLDTEPNRLDANFRATLYAQTGGHPLFTVELLRGMQERGDLRRATDEAWIASYEIDWETLPARIEGAIGERIDRLEPGLRDLLQWASVAGETFSLELLAHLVGREPRQLVRRFSQELDRRHRLVQALGVRREGERRLSRYRFAHILIQRYLYQTLDEVERVYRHEAAATALESLYGADAPAAAAEIARHFTAASLSERAAPYYRHAGDQARRAAAPAEATANYRRALAAWPQADGAGRALLHRRLGEVSWVTGQLQAAQNHFETAHDLYLEVGDTAGAGGTQRAIGRLFWEQGERERSLVHHRRALDLLEKGPETVELARSYSAISQMHMLAWEYDEALAWGERALALAERLEAPPDVFSHALNNVGISLLWLGKPDEALAKLRESKKLALTHHLPHDAGRGFYNAGTVLLALDRTAEAWTEFDRMGQYAERWQVPLYAGSAQAELMGVEWLGGQWRTARARLPAIQAWLDRSESLTYLQNLQHLIQASIANTLGRAEAALTYLEACAPAVQSSDEAQVWIPYLNERIRALSLLGRHEEAGLAVEKLLTFSGEGFVMLGLNVLMLRAGCYWAIEHRRWEEATALLEQIERISNCFASRTATAVLQECRGLFAFHRDEEEEAVSQLRLAVADWQELAYPYDEARAGVALAQALSSAGREEQAQAVRERAGRLLETLAAELEEEEARTAFLASPLVRAAGLAVPSITTI